MLDTVLYNLYPTVEDKTIQEDTMKYIKRYLSKHFPGTKFEVVPEIQILQHINVLLHMEAFTLDSTEIIVLATAGGLFFYSNYLLPLSLQPYSCAQPCREAGRHALRQELPFYIRHHLRP